MNGDNKQDPQQQQQRVFGFGSADEMCIHFLFYYPKKNLHGAPFGCGIGMEQYHDDDLPEGSSCEATYERVQNANDMERNLHQWRTFGQAAACNVL
jgi:Copper type II ascorbate-dependent monooxygenase, C-terminal domain